jgi:hypothetical protein
VCLTSDTPQTKHAMAHLGVDNVIMVRVPELQHSDLFLHTWHLPQEVQELLCNAEAAMDSVEASVSHSGLLHAHVLLLTL